MLDNRLDVIIGPTGRRRWSAEAKARIVAESFDPAETATGVARKHGISASLLFLWRKQVREGKIVLPEDAISAFAPLMVDDDPPKIGGPARSFDPAREVVEIHAHGIVVCLGEDTSASRIARITCALWYEFS